MRTSHPISGRALRGVRLAALLGAATVLAAAGAQAAVQCVPNAGIDGSCAAGFPTIQAAVTAATSGDTVLVDDGTYTEFVTIATNLTLLSKNGAAVTTIAPPATPTANLGTVLVTGGTTGVQIGAPGKGFTIQGIDNASPGIESAALYFQGSHSNAKIRNNQIVAAGDEALLTEFGATISGFVIDSNVFSGQTFAGPTAGDCGFGNQFTAANVPRQLVVVSGGTGGGNTSNTTFTNNTITGTAGSLNAAGREQGNNLVTIDSNGATITGNTFAGTTSRFGVSLRARGPATTISANVFNSTGLLTYAAAPLCSGPIDAQHDRLSATGQVTVTNVGSNLATIVAANTFDRGVYVGALVGPDATVGLSVEFAVSAVPAGTTVEVLPGTYDEQVSITTANLTVNGAGAVIAPSQVFSDTTQGSPCSNGVGTAAVLVSGVTGVTLNGITVDGSLIASVPARWIGIYYRNASGRIDGATVTHIRNHPLNGVQAGNGIVVQAKGPTVAAVDTANVTVTEYQKNGITYNGCGCADTVDGVATGTISGSTITGAGAQALIAQNGIQVGFGAGPVTVGDNAISGNRYTGDPNNGTGAGILLFSTKNNSVTSNDVSQNNYGVVIQGGSFGLCVAGDSTGNSLSCNSITGHDAFAFEAAVQADAAANQAHDNAITGNAIGIDGSGITSGNLDATGNWFGCPTGPNTAGCDSTVGNVNATPFSATIPACVGCTTNADCNDGLVCNGVETCNTFTNTCQAGTPPDCSNFTDQCNTGTCSEPSGCGATPKPNTTVCTGPAGDTCSIPDRCDGTGTCVDAGGGDPDGDHICSNDDNCPTIANPNQSNIDGQDGGDVCDPIDGTLDVTRIQFKANTAGANDNSNATFKGSFLVTAPTDVFSSASPISLTVTDGLGQSRTVTFSSAECKSSATKVSCRSTNRLNKTVFHTRTGSKLWAFSGKFKKQNLTTPFDGPATLHLSYDTGIDREDTVQDCVNKFTTLRCREF